MTNVMTNVTHFDSLSSDEFTLVLSKFQIVTLATLLALYVSWTHGKRVLEFAINLARYKRLCGFLAAFVLCHRLTLTMALAITRDTRFALTVQKTASHEFDVLDSHVIFVLLLILLGWFVVTAVLYTTYLVLYGFAIGFSRLATGTYSAVKDYFFEDEFAPFDITHVVSQFVCPDVSESFVNVTPESAQPGSEFLGVQSDASFSARVSSPGGKCLGWFSRVTAGDKKFFVVPRHVIRNAILAGESTIKGRTDSLLPFPDCCRGLLYLSKTPSDVMVFEDSADLSAKLGLKAIKVQPSTCRTVRVAGRLPDIPTPVISMGALIVSLKEKMLPGHMAHSASTVPGFSGALLQSRSGAVGMHLASMARPQCNIAASLGFLLPRSATAVCESDYDPRENAAREYDSEDEWREEMRRRYDPDYEEDGYYSDGLGPRDEDGNLLDWGDRDDRDVGDAEMDYYFGHLDKIEREMAWKSATIESDFPPSKAVAALRALKANSRPARVEPRTLFRLKPACPPVLSCSPPAPDPPPVPAPSTRVTDSCTAGQAGLVTSVNVVEARANSPSPSTPAKPPVSPQPKALKKQSGSGKPKKPKASALVSSLKEQLSSNAPSTSTLLGTPTTVPVSQLKKSERLSELQKWFLSLSPGQKDHHLREWAKSSK